MKTYCGLYDSKVYPREALLKTAYLFINENYLHIRVEGDFYAVEITPKNTPDNGEVIKEFENELLAATVRLDVYRQTHVLREVMLGRAMASTMIVDDDKAVVEDEIGVDASLNNILQDWFDHE